MKSKVIPEVSICAEYHNRILKPLDVAAVTRDYFTRKLKPANAALINCIAWLSTRLDHIDRPLPELTVQFRKCEYFSHINAFEQGLVQDLFRRLVELVRKDLTLLLTVCEVDNLTELTRRLSALGQSAKEAFNRENKFSEAQ